MPAPTTLLLGLTRRYCEPHRHYHTIGHIADMLWRARQLPLDDEQLLAIWYHDAIFDIPGDGNERRSAELAFAELCAIGWPEARARQVERMVLDTEQHLPSIAGSALVIDLDLASLAGSEAEFDRNTAALRREFHHLDDARFAAGQRAMCERFLRRPRIYHSEWGAQFETAARHNLRRLLDA